jgi:hypothetical protein
MKSEKTEDTSTKVKKAKTHRERRLVAQEYQLSEITKSHIPWAEGNLVIKENGQEIPEVQIHGSKITFDMSELYIDDVLGIVRDWIKHYLVKYPIKGEDDPNRFNQSALKWVNTAIDLLDERAVEKHAYSRNPEEANFKKPN